MTITIVDRLSIIYNIPISTYSTMVYPQQSKLTLALKNNFIVDTYYLILFNVKRRKLVVVTVLK